MNFVKDEGNGSSSVVRFYRLVGRIGSILDIVSYQNRFSKFPEDRYHLNIVFEGLRNIGIVSISFWRVLGISVSYQYRFGEFLEYRYRPDIVTPVSINNYSLPLSLYNTRGRTRPGNTWDPKPKPPYRC